MNQEPKLLEQVLIPEPKVTRSDGERIRLRHAIARLRALVDAAELAIEERAPPSPMVGESVAHAGVGVAVHLAQLAAYLQAEGDPT